MYMSMDMVPHGKSKSGERIMSATYRVLAISGWPLVVLIALVSLVLVGVAIQRLLNLRQSAAKRTPVGIAKKEDEDLTIFYASQKGHAKRFAHSLAEEARARGVSAVAIDLVGFDPDRLVEHGRLVFVVATYAGGTAVPGTEGVLHEVSLPRQNSLIHFSARSSHPRLLRIHYDAAFDRAILTSFQDAGKLVKYWRSPDCSR